MFGVAWRVNQTELLARAQPDQPTILSGDQTVRVDWRHHTVERVEFVAIHVSRGGIEPSWVG